MGIFNQSRRAMKLQADQSEALMMIAEFDQKISQQRAALEDLSSGKSVSELRSQLAGASETYLQKSTELENLKVAIARGQVDLDSVEKRIAHDEKLLAQTSSAKDAEGIGHELRSLANRKSDLEDAALGLLDEYEAAQADYERALATKAELANKLESESSMLADKVTYAQSALALLVQQREQKLAGLPGDLAALYLKKLSRGIGAARLLHRDCGACRIALTATAYDEVMAAPSDELVTCPNCQTILVRW
jgi:uncharacterized protein